MIIVSIREYLKDATPSDVYINGEWFCYGLEDVARPVNVKIQNETCIPEGVYTVAITRSLRFKRDMLHLFNHDEMLVRRDGVTYSGIRVHGGNDTGDTAGCILVAQNKTNDNKIYGSMEIALFTQLYDSIKNDEDVMWVISSG